MHIEAGVLATWSLNDALNRTKGQITSLDQGSRLIPALFKMRAIVKQWE